MTAHDLVDFSRTTLYVSLFAIAFNPIAWNLLARNEYKNRTITRLFGGSPRHGCYALAICIFSFGILRDSFYHRALEEQPRQPILPEPYATWIPIVMFLVGQMFVVTSTWALGITGTFLGDYFGILMDHKVEGFPFNVLRDPMYIGSSVCFAATALWYERPIGLLIAIYTYVVYLIALRFEGPFTDMIYSNRAVAAAKPLKKDL